MPSTGGGHDFAFRITDSNCTSAAGSSFRAWRTRPKRYRVTGSLWFNWSDRSSEALAPAKLEVLGARQARLTLTEGRYHQARRMFAAVGNHVEKLHRSRVGGLTLGDLPEGKWRILDAADIAQLFGK